MAHRIVLSAVSVLIALALAGCVADGPVKIPATGLGSSVPTAPTMSASAQPSDPASPVTSVPAPAPATFSIPTDCTKIVNPTTYATAFENTPLNDPGVTGKPGAEDYTATGVVTPSASSPGAAPKVIMANSIQLRCIWRFPQADITYLEVEIGTVDPTVAARYFDALPAQKFACSDLNAGKVCRFQEQLVEYPVVAAHTEFVRDSVYIRVDQANFKTNNLLGAIVTTVWG